MLNTPAQGSVVRGFGGLPPVLKFLCASESLCLCVKYSSAGVRSQESGVSELELESGIDIFFIRNFNTKAQRHKGTESRVGC